MTRLSTLPLAMILIIPLETFAQGRVVATFPYNQNFDWVMGSTTGFPVTNIDGGEFTSDAGTGAVWTTSIAAHGLNNNGGAGGAIRLQSTGSGGAAGLLWYADLTGHCADSLLLDWSKVRSGAAANPPRFNELRVATNNGAGSLFTDLPPAGVAGGAWPSFDNGVAPESGTLRVKLPAALTEAPDVRIRIYSTNIGGTGSHPRVVVDNLVITTLPPPPTGSIDSAGEVGYTTMRLFISQAESDSIVLVRRAGAAPVARPVDGRRYRTGEGLNGTDSVLFAGPATVPSIRFTGLRVSTTYHFALYGMRSCNARYSLVPASGSASTLLCDEGPGAVEQATTIFRGRDSIVIGHVAGAHTDSVLIVRRRGDTPAFRPIDGIRYVAGQGVSAADTVIYAGPPGVPVVARGLQPDAHYLFTLHGFRSCNTTYSSLPLHHRARTYCDGEAGNVRNAALRYTTATEAGLALGPIEGADAVLIFSNGPDPHAPAPVDGLPCSLGAVIGDDTVRYLGGGGNPIVRGLSPSTTYRFTILGMRECSYDYSARGKIVRGTTLGPCSGKGVGNTGPVGIARNIRDTLQLHWRPASGATGYLLVARIDSTPAEAPASGRFYQAGDSLGRGTFVLATTSDTAILLTRLPANSAYFLRIHPYRECDLRYGDGIVTAVATRGTAFSQRFAIRGGSRDTIRFAGALVEFREPVTADGSLLITRTGGPTGSNGVPMHRNDGPAITHLSMDRRWSMRRTGLGRTVFDLGLDISGMPGIDDTSDLEILFRTEPFLPWEDYITTGYRTDGMERYLIAANRTRFSSDYAVGGNRELNILPIHLLSFEGFSRNGRSYLRWRTAAEREHAGFRLYRAAAESDTIHFLPVADYADDARLRGSAERGASHDYTYIDTSRALRPGATYLYMLEEVTLDGTASEAGRLLLSTDIGRNPSSLPFRITPSPVTGATMTINYTVTGEGGVEITLANVVGRKVRMVMDDAAPAVGSHATRVDVDDLPAGLYFCHFASKNGLFIQPVIIAK